MYSKIRCAAAVLIVSTLTCGSLSAFPLTQARALGEREVPTLTQIVDWVVSLFVSDGAQGKAPRHPRAKYASQVDPDGSP